MYLAHIQVVPVFAGGLDFSSPVKKFFYDPLGSGKNFVDCVVSLTGVCAVAFNSFSKALHLTCGRGLIAGITLPDLQR